MDPRPDLDYVVAARLRDEFKWRRRLHSIDCVIAVDTGTVTLSTRIESARDRTVAISIAMNIPGVSSVHFGRASRSHEPHSRTEDADLARRVVDALANTSHVPSPSTANRVRVRAHRGVVILDGRLEAKYQRDAAVRVAEALYGVVRVESRIGIRRSA